MIGKVTFEVPTKAQETEFKIICGRFLKYLPANYKDSYWTVISSRYFTTLVSLGTPHTQPMVIVSAIAFMAWVFSVAEKLYPDKKPDPRDPFWVDVNSIRLAIVGEILPELETDEAIAVSHHIFRCARAIKTSSI
jgi:hypothetical protein